MDNYYHKYTKYKSKYLKLKILHHGGGNLPQDEIKWPFRKFVTDTNKQLKIVAITAPFRGDNHVAMYNILKNKGYEFIGLSSYLEFPGEIKNPHEDQYHKKHPMDYQNMVKCWLHCFRNSNYIRLPKLLFSESDLIDPNKIKPNTSVNKIYDIIYIGYDDSKDKCVEGWQSYNRNWKLAQKCFNLICQKIKLNILIIGKTNCKVTCNNGTITTIPFQKHGDFIKYLQQTKIIFLPNISDASPRALAEALCCDVRALVNYNIVGGWKYINNNTGEFFNSEIDFMEKLEKILNNYNSYKPREWFINNYGLQKSGKILLEFLKHQQYSDPELNNAKYVTL